MSHKTRLAHQMLLRGIGLFSTTLLYHHTTLYHRPQPQVLLRDIALFEGVGKGDNTSAGLLPLPSASAEALTSVGRVVAK